MRFDVLTLFPELCQTILNESIIGRAQKKGAISCHCHNFRDFAMNKHNRIDDTPYGGGKGMLLMAPPIYRCYEDIVATSGSKPHVIYLSPQGKTLTQERAAELAQKPHLALICGHYEGVDERLIEKIVDEEISIGDFVLTGGELPAMILIETVARLCPGVLADSVCFEEESHYGGLLEYPQYTRPEEWEGMAVPEVLRTGHHKNIQKWQREQSLLRTAKKRPELLAKAELSAEDGLYLRLLPPYSKEPK